MGDYVKQKKVEYAEFNNEIFRELLDLFNALAPEYIRMEKALRIRSGHVANS